MAALCGQLPKLWQHLQVPYGVLPQELGQFSEPSVPDLEDMFGQVRGAAFLQPAAHLQRTVIKHSKADGAVCVQLNCRQHMLVFAHILVLVVPLVGLNSCVADSGRCRYIVCWSGSVTVLQTQYNQYNERL